VQAWISNPPHAHRCPNEDVTLSSSGEFSLGLSSARSGGSRSRLPRQPSGERHRGWAALPAA